MVTCSLCCHQRLFSKLITLRLIVALIGLLPLFCKAQSPESGVITGRIYNPVSGQYVRNAQLEIAGTNKTVTSTDEGFYRFEAVAPGEVTILVIYTGYKPVTAVVNVTAGQTVTRDFELFDSLHETSAGDSPVKLDTYVVSSQREGNAKAIMNQRNSMNIVDSVASDVYGDMAEGTVTTFLKHLPGVELEIAGDQGRFVRLRGLDAAYTGVTLDGVSLASADANSAGTANSRSFTFEQVSLSSMDSIEISKTVSADQDANAPAGTINLKTKRGFDRKGRFISWQVNATAMSEQFNFEKAYGPNDARKTLGFRPGGIFEYSDVFLNKRAGIVLNLSEYTDYGPDVNFSHTYNFTPTAADPRPAVLTSMATSHTPRHHGRFTATLTGDFKATPNLVLSMGYIYNHFDLWSHNYTTTFNTGARNTVVGSDPLLSFSTSSTAASVALGQNGTIKIGETQSYLPKFEYKKGDLTIEGRFAASISKNDYRPMQRRGSFEGAAVDPLSGIGFRANRSSVLSADWTITQVSGLDWSDLSNYKNPRAADDSRHMKRSIYSGEVTASYITRWLLPISWKAGIKSAEDIIDYSSSREYTRWNYTGPGGGTTGSWAAYPTGYSYDLSMVDSRINAPSGRGIVFPNLQAIGDLFKEHPEYFTHAGTAADYYTAFVANDKEYKETINAAFLMGTTKIGKLQFRAGLRWEETKTVSSEFDPLPGSVVVAAGFPVASGRATTIPGLNYQYFTNPRVDRMGGYDYFHPSASAKYLLTKNLSLHVGYSNTIKRPTFNDVTGIWVIDEVNLRVTVPNPNLEPELSDNYSARLAYYFEPVGLFGISFFENKITGLRATNEFSAEEFGYGDDPLYANYTFVSGVRSDQEKWVKGMELEYNQSLSFLPAPFKGLTVRASYTRNYSDSIRALLSPHATSGGLSYSYKRFSANASFTWTDDTPTNTTGSTYRRHRTLVDAGGGYRISNKVSLFFTVKNVFNAPWQYMQKSGDNPALVQRYQSVGTKWTFGVKGTF